MVDEVAWDFGFIVANSESFFLAPLLCFVSRDGFDGKISNLECSRWEL